MKDPVRVGDGLTDHSVGDERAKQDRLIAEIEAAANLPDYCVDQAMRTLAELRDSPVPWIATRYLQAVLTRGAAMFDAAPAVQLPLGASPTLACGCGADAPIHDRERVDGRWMLYARCPACGGDLVAPEVSDTGGRPNATDGVHSP